MGVNVGTSAGAAFWEPAVQLYWEPNYLLYIAEAATSFMIYQNSGTPDPIDCVVSGSSFFGTGKFEDNGACFFVFVVLSGNVSNQFPIR